MTGCSHGAPGRSALCTRMPSTVKKRPLRWTRFPVSCWNDQPSSSANGMRRIRVPWALRRSASHATISSVVVRAPVAGPVAATERAILAAVQFASPGPAGLSCLSGPLSPSGPSGPSGPSCPVSVPCARELSTLTDLTDGLPRTPAPRR